MSERGGDVVARNFKPVLEAVEEAVEVILSEAEAEASRLIAEAEAEAQRIVAQKSSELSSKADDMLANANQVNSRAESLLEALDTAIASLGASAQSDASPPETSQQPERAPRASAQPGIGISRPRPAVRLDQPTAPGSGAEGQASFAEADASAAGAESAPDGGTEREPLRALRRRLSEIGRPPRTISRPFPQDHAPVTPQPRTSPQRPASAPGNVSEGAVLLATQMAVAGSDRAQIESRLRNDFGIENPEEILDGLI